MSSPPSHPPLPAALARFPREVQAAFERFRAARGSADLRIVVHAALRDFIPKRVGYAADTPLTAELRLVEDLGFDSLAVAETVFFFEDLFNVSIPTQEILALRTVGELEAFVSSKLSTTAIPA